MKQANIENVRVEYTGHSSRFLCEWEAHGARYHFWFTIDAGDRVRLDVDVNALAPFPVIYKNPPRGIKHNGPGDFKTRKLNGNVPGNAAMIAQARARIKAQGLIALAVAAHEKAQRDEDKALAAMVLQNRKEAAGPALYSALEACAGALALAVEMAREQKQEAALLRFDNARRDAQWALALATKGKESTP